MSYLREIQRRDKGLKVDYIEEVWVDCIFNNEYEVSNHSLVRRKEKKRKNSNDILPMKYCNYSKNYGYKASRNGRKLKDKYYFMVSLGSVGCKKLHQVVYYSFYPEQRRTEGDIDHINGISQDNRLINLRKISCIDNAIKGDRDDSNELF